MSDCIFCKIANGEIPTEFIYRDDSMVAFNDLHPLAPVHVLIIPKRHIKTIDDLKDEDGELVGKMIIQAKKIARSLNISEKGYKLLFRVKEYGGQEIDHIHLHLIGGAPLVEKIHPINS